MLTEHKLANPGTRYRMHSNYVKAHAILSEQVELAITDLESSQTIPIAWAAGKIDQVIMRLRDAQERAEKEITS